MKVASGTVLTLAGAMSSPALWRGLVTGELPMDVALTRYLVAVVIAWAALSIVVSLVGDPPRLAQTPPDAEQNSDGDAEVRRVSPPA